MCLSRLCRQSILIPNLGLGIEEEQPDYDMDSDDEVWLNAQSKDRVSDQSLICTVCSTAHEAPLLPATRPPLCRDQSLYLPMVYSTTHVAPLLQDHLSVDTSPPTSP